MVTLYYIHDPMCSWCWGFAKTFEKLKSHLDSEIKIVYLLGGLAPDTNNPMLPEMQKYIQQTWQHIQKEIPGTEFNFSFWENNIPKRSTYPACRALLAARKMNPEKYDDMLISIQEAYYLKALNPSDEHVLVQLAKDIKLDTNLFTEYLHSTEIQDELENEIHLSGELGAQGFPSLILKNNEELYFIPIDYNNHLQIINALSVPLANCLQ